MVIFNKDNNLAGKAKFAASRVMALSEKKLADLILKAVNKQDRVNDILHQRGSDYRINSIDVEVGLPPKIVFGITSVTSETCLDVDADVGLDEHDMESKHLCERLAELRYERGTYTN